MEQQQSPSSSEQADSVSYMCDDLVPYISLCHLLMLLSLAWNKPYLAISSCCVNSTLGIIFFFLSPFPFVRIVLLFVII